MESILDLETLKRIGSEGVLIAIVTMIAYFVGLEQSHGLAATLAFATLCLSRLFHGFNCRSHQSIFEIGLFSNRYSIGGLFDWIHFIKYYFITSTIKSVIYGD